MSLLLPSWLGRGWHDQLHVCLHVVCLTHSTQHGSELTSAIVTAVTRICSLCIGVDQSRIGCHHLGCVAITESSSEGLSLQPSKDWDTTPSVFAWQRRACLVLAYFSCCQSAGSPTDLLLSCDSISSGWRFGWLAINQHPHPLQLFLVESLRSLSPYQERSIAQLSKELTGLSLSPDQPNQFD